MLLTLKPVALALTIGLLIGLERGWQARKQPEGTRVAGFRTFGLLELTGGIAAALPVPLAAVMLLGAAAIMVAGYVRGSATEHDRSATGALAAILTLGLGTLAGSGHGVEALAAAAIATLLLAMRNQLHAALKGISATEIEAISRFAIVALVILPLMPDRSFGPLDAWNPRQLWFVVVLVSGLSFVGYAAARRMGATRGLLVTAAAGALVSSTAVTVTYARALREPGEGEAALIAGIGLASAVMYARVLLLTALLAPMALPTLALTMVPALLAQLALVGLSVRRAPATMVVQEVKLGNPLDFRPALALAAFVAILAVVSRFAIQEFGGAGVGVLLTLAGFADVDAAIITLAGLPDGAVSADAAGLLLALPVLANTALKAGLAFAIAPNRRGALVAGSLLAGFAAGAAGATVLALV